MKENVDDSVFRSVNLSSNDACYPLNKCQNNIVITIFSNVGATFIKLQIYIFFILK